MVAPAGHISATEAARRLGVSASTVHNWLRGGHLGGVSGDQPKRPRCYIAVNDSGLPVDPNGTPVPMAVTRSASQFTAAAGSSSHIVAALQMSAAMETHRRAFGLVLEAMRLIDQAMAEQGEIIAGLLVGEPNVETSDP